MDELFRASLSDAEEFPVDTINISQESANFQQARREASSKAGENLTEPVIITWKDDDSGQIAPEIPGATSNRWQDYAKRNGGKLEVNVGNQFHFVFTEAVDFDGSKTSVATLVEQDGTAILCTRGACTKEERQKLGYLKDRG